MPELDLVVRGGAVVLPGGIAQVDVGVAGGRIAALGPAVGDGTEEIDATGLHVFPGGVDPHVHFNTPGRDHWEGVETGSAALACGGFTTFVDMPLNNTPVTIDGPSLDAKVAALEGRSVVDYGLWGGLVPGNLDRLAELHERGVLGFKAFMCHSGLDEFPAADDLTLLEGMQRIAALGSILLLHAENAAIVAGLSARARAEGRLTPRDFARARPPVSELEAVERAIRLADSTGCRVHLVHLSLVQSVETVVEAAGRGVDVSCETCPHFLLFDEDDLARIGLPLKSAPPVRSRLDREGLWQHVAGGLMVASDHSPGHPEVKQGSFFDAWGGISGCQSTLQLLLAAGYAGRGIALETIAESCGGAAARRFGLAGKGAIEAGADADLALVDLAWTAAVRSDDLCYRHPTSAYEGLPIRGRVVRTLLRGRPVVDGGYLAYPARGRFVPAADRKDNR